jgi:hypothetical protein
LKTYDAVAVCSGSFNSPRFPEDIDLNSYSGKVYHSSTYKDVSDFTRHESIFIVGAANSAVDISLELWKAGKKVFLFHRKPENLKGFPDDVIQIRKSISSSKNDEIKFSDGSSVSCDAVLFCTGYDTDISFLDKTCRLSVKGDLTVFPLYLYMINPFFPSMALLGRLFTITPFLLCEYQAILFAKLLTKTVQLPSETFMIKEAYNLMNYDKDVNDRHLYLSTNRMENHMEYYREIGNIIGEHLIEYEYGVSLHKKVLCHRNFQPLTYRDCPNSFWENQGSKKK